LIGTVLFSVVIVFSLLPANLVWLRLTPQNPLPLPNPFAG
jgi:hypothetical protein